MTSIKVFKYLSRTFLWQRHPTLTLVVKLHWNPAQHPLRCHQVLQLPKQQKSKIGRCTTHTIYKCAILLFYVIWFKTLCYKNDVPEEVQVLFDNIAAWVIQLHEKTSLKSLERTKFRGKWFTTQRVLVIKWFKTSLFDICISYYCKWNIHYTLKQYNLE